ncbi:ATP-binding protein [Streptomyces uncialis]|uniref:ATP-binding protein n=1 Tax=Streptomyces uncialis TaxID=1048205 RepID=UPI003807CDCA
MSSVPASAARSPRRRGLPRRRRAVDARTRRLRARLRVRYVLLMAAGAAVPSTAWLAADAGLGPGLAAASAGSLGAAALALAGVRAGRDAATVGAGYAQRARQAGQLAAQLAQWEESSGRWLERYGRAVGEGRAGLEVVLREIEAGGSPRPETPVPDGPAGERFAAFEAFLRRAWTEAAVSVAASARAGRATEPAVIASISPRLQSLIGRALAVLEDLERDTEDPDLLGGLFRVDHVTTLQRRYVASLTVLSGRPLPARTSAELVPAVLRAAIAATEDYSRARMTAWPHDPVRVAGHAVPGVEHLLAALIDNALAFSAGDQQVRVTAQLVGAGLAVEVEDRGVLMTPALLARANDQLRHPEPGRLREQLADGRIGLPVCALIARRYGISVELRRNICGGTTALAVLPTALLTTAPATDPDPGPGPRPVRSAAGGASVAGPPSGQPGATPAAGVPAVSGPGIRAHLPAAERPGAAAPSGPAGLPRRRGAPVPAAGPVTTGDDGVPAEEGLPVLPRRSRSPGPVVRSRPPAEPGPPTPGLVSRFNDGIRNNSGPGALPPA